MKADLNDASISVPDFTALDEFLLGTTLPVPHLDGSVLTVYIGLYAIKAIFKVVSVALVKPRRLTSKTTFS